MSSKQLRSRIIPVAALLALLSSCFPAFAQSGGFSIRPIVRRGDPVGDGGRFFDCDVCEGRVAGLHALNNRGDVAIGAHVVSGSCFSNRFLISSGQVIRLADFCHPTEFGDLTLLGPVNLSDQGHAVMLAGITVNNRIIPMLLKHSEGRLTKIVQEGDVSPIGTIFRGCGFGEPAINNQGDVAFHACAETADGFFNDGVFVYSQQGPRKVVAGGDPSPVGGEFFVNFFPGQPAQINDNGDVLFRARVILNPQTQRFGLFLQSGDVIKKIELDGEQMPGGSVITKDSLGIGDLNNRGEVVFAIGLTGQPDGGIFLHSGDSLSKIVVAGDRSPIGGVFSPFAQGQPFPLPNLNDNGTVAFRASVTGGSASSGIFLASPRAMLKVLVVGDVLPTGETIREINSFALNDLGEVAFFAFGKRSQRKPLGVFLATPLTPAIISAKLKQKAQGLELRVNGTAMITNDSVIEVNGVALDQLSYPEGFRENGGTITRVVSRDPRFVDLIKPGEPVEITVFNPLTNRRSAPLTLVR